MARNILRSAGCHLGILILAAACASNGAGQTPGRAAGSSSLRQTADSALMAALRASSQDLVGDTVHVSPPGDTTGAMAGRALDPDWESFFRPYYPGLSDPSSHVFAVARVAMGPGLSGYVLRVPGQYAPLAMALWIHDDRGGYWLPPSIIAEAGVDGTWSFQQDAWLLDRDGDGYRDLVQRTMEWDLDSFPVLSPDFRIADTISWRAFQRSSPSWGPEQALQGDEESTFVLAGQPSS